MSKKEKSALVENIQVITTMIPKLENIIKMHKEIALSYQKYRKNGGTAISGIEKYLGIKELVSVPTPKKKETTTKVEVKEPKESSEAKKTKKKVKK